MGNGDNFALDWIKGELESTLDQARVALESYAEGGREETRLRSCLTSLHQVHGTMRMLELEGVVLLADHMEQTAQSLLNGSIKDARLAEQALMQCILQLPAFIEEVQNGVTEDLPLVMPYVNELRSCCDLTPMQLTPQISAEFSAEDAAEAMQRFRDINGAEKAARIRTVYQQVLLSVLKGGASAQTVETLGKIATGMARICDGAPMATLWKSLEHFAKSYASDPRRMSSEALRDLRRVDAEMKKVATEGADVLLEPVPVELVRDLLRAAESRGERDDQITQLRSSVQTPTAAHMKPREALDQAAGVLREEIAAVRDRFDLFTRANVRQASELQELTAPLDSICSTLGMLGDTHGADLLRDQRAKVLLLEEDSDVSEELIQSLAGALVQSEQGLSGSDDIASDDAALASSAFSEAHLAVLQEARSGIDTVKQSIVDFVSSKWNTGYLEESPQVLTAVQGALAMIPLPRASELLASCRDYVADRLLQGHHPDWKELDSFADALGGIDYFLERLFETGREPGDEALNLTEESLRGLIGDVAQGSLPAQSPADSQTNAETEAGGDVAINAMLGAQPEELRFVPEADEQEALADSSFDLVDLEIEETEAKSEDSADALAEATSDAITDTAQIGDEPKDLTQTSFVGQPEGQPNDHSGSVSVGSASVGALAAGAAAAGAAAGFSAFVGSDARDTTGEVVHDGGDNPGNNDAQVPSQQSDTQAEPEEHVVDAEIVEIFAEEVDEVLEAIEAQLPDWSEDLLAVTPITEIRRNFHTLKGSGRIVGANQIGELGWAVENMLNRLMDATFTPSEDHLFVVSHACRIVPEMRDDFVQGRSTDRTDLNELLEQVDVLASGGVLAGALAKTTPAAPDAKAAEEPTSPESIAEEDFPVWDDEGLGEEPQSSEAAESPIANSNTNSDANSDDMRPPAVAVPSFLGSDSASDSLSAEPSESLANLASEALAEGEFAGDMQDHLEVLSEQIRTTIADDKLELDSSFTGALHTITGSAATAGESAIVGIAEPLQDVTSAVVRDRGGVLDGEHLAFVREGVYALQRLLDSDAPQVGLAEDDSAMFAAEAQRLLGGLVETPDGPQSLLKSDDTAVLLEARDYLDGWRSGAHDLERAQQMNRALITVIERAHTDDLAELAEVLHLAHGQFADEHLNEERHNALLSAHDDLLVQLDGIASGQASSMSLDSLERLQELMSEISQPQDQSQGWAAGLAGSDSAPETTPSSDLDDLAPDDLGTDDFAIDDLAVDDDNPVSDLAASDDSDDSEDEEPLDDDAQEALAYELDDSDTFDLDALDEDVFAADESDTVTEAQLPETLASEAQAPEEQAPEMQASEGAASAAALAATVAVGMGVGMGMAASDQTEDSQETEKFDNAAVDSGSSAASKDAQEEYDDEVDHELLAIFFEEADELLEEFDHNLQEWSSDRSNSAPLDNLLRGLHTLKGGARLAGLSQLGDMTHNYESDLIETQNSGAEVSDAQFEVVQQRYDDLVEAVALAKNNEPIPSALSEQPVAQVVVDEPVSSIESGAPADDFAMDVEEAFSPDSIADIDAEEALEREKQQKAAEQKAAEAKAAAQEQAENTALTGASVAAGALLAAGASALSPESTQESTQESTPEKAAEAAPVAAAAKATDSSTTSAQDDDRSRNAQEMVRVSATLLENLVNLAGESSIIRARVEQGISDFGGALEEMETTIERVREQLRRLEIETETRVSSRIERTQGPGYEDFDPLEMDRYSQLQQLTRSLTESATDMMDLKETLRYRARESETLLLQQARLNTELQEGLMRTRMVPFSRLMPRLRRIVRQVSRDLDKQVEFQAYNAEGELDRNVLERMVPPLEHMLRNAIDHGIESEEARHNFGKPSIGRIGLKLSREGGDVVIEITDDGAGIDVESVRAKAVERGMMAADASLTDEQVLDFVLAPGFSTAASLTQISGRGVGMDVVHSEVKQLGGIIEISSQPGRGTTFTVRLPFTVSVNRALMVSLGDDQYAIPLNTIEGIVLLGSDELSKHSGPEGEPFEYAGISYQVRYLGSYLEREYVERGEQTSVPVVLVRSGDQAVAVHVDDVQGSREIVVKSLGPQFAGVGGISGATILGDGSVVVILDLLSLMRNRGADNRHESRLPTSAEEERWVLVVDDSVTVRKVTSRLLERQGMNVITAKDGVEAVSVLQERLPDIMLLDIEMPRMDGFEVARQVRRDERLEKLPIVMISSRTGSKHTDRARELGVNRFLGKPFQENELLEVIDELVTGH